MVENQIVEIKPYTLLLIIRTNTSINIISLQFKIDELFCIKDMWEINFKINVHFYKTVGFFM